MSNWMHNYEIDASLRTDAGAVIYPVAAWNQGAGGLVMEVAKAEEHEVELTWPIQAVTFGRGAKSTARKCFVAQVAEVAILAYRTRWYDRATDEQIAGYRDGAYSRLHILALAKGANPSTQPVMLSFKGVVAGGLSKQITQAQRLISATGRKAGHALALPGFWLTIRAGGVQTVGRSQQVEITPALLDLPGRDEDVLHWLGERFVGPDLLAFVNESAEEITAWRDHDKERYQTEEAEAEPITPASNGNTPQPALAGNVHGDQAEIAFWATARGLGMEGNPIAQALGTAAVYTGRWDDAMTALHGLAGHAPA